MGTKLIIDNWMLQDVNQVLQEGLYEDEVGEIVINLDKGTHNFKYLPHAIFQIDALLTLLVNIVLRDELFVDSGFTYVWDKGHESLRNVQKAGILVPTDFLTSEKLISETRKAIVSKLCVTPSILAIQKENERSWEEIGETKDNYMSQLVWGCAGYLARSDVYETPYLGCSFRQALIRQTDFVYRNHDAVRSMETILKTKRAQLFQSLTDERTGAYASFNLPPIATEVIENANNVPQLITVALQLRHKYKRLREWLGQYQNALDSENPKDIMKHVRLLEYIAHDIDSKYSDRTSDAISLSLGTAWLTIGNITVDGIATKIRNKFGVRAILTDLVFSKQGATSLKKILKMLGERNPQLTTKLHAHLVNKYSGLP